MIDEPFCSSGRKISPMPARGPEPISARSLAILVSDTATTFSAPDSSTSASRLPCASNGSSGAEISRPLSSVSSARTLAANSGWVFRPVLVERGEVHGAREHVVRGLAEVDVVVGVHALAGQRGDDLVGVHVARRTGAGLEDVDRELVVVAPIRHLGRALSDALREVRVEQ